MVTKFHESNLTGPQNSRPRQEVSRLLTAAVISSQFRQVLLSNPTKALTSGYGGEKFNLPREHQKRVASIRANTLADFASQLTSIEASWSGTSVAGD
jgi:hypothetical protein